MVTNSIKTFKNGSIKKKKKRILKDTLEQTKPEGQS